MCQKKYKLFISICSVVLVLAVLCCIMFSTTFLNKKEQSKTDDGIPFETMESSYEGSKTEYTKVSETDSLIMMANLYSGDFYITNKATGTNWYSTPHNAENDEITTGSKRTNLHSQLYFEYLYKDDEISAVSLESANSKADSLMENGIIVKVIENGIYVTYNFNLLKIKIPVFYTLDKESLVAEVDFENIVVDDSIYLMSISLLPSFGANYDSNDGYLFIPDGSGAIVNFNNSVNSADYEKLIYGENSAISNKTKTTQEESIRLPVFGVKKQNDSFISVVENGDKSTAICAYNKNNTCAYDTVFSKRILRTLTSKTIYEKDAANRQNIGRVTQADVSDGYKLIYYFLSGENSNYVGMANKYKSYLFGDLKDNKISEPSFNIEVAGAFDSYASFLGIPYTKIKSLTKYTELKNIIEELKNKGIDKINIRYNGWSGDGILNINRIEKVGPISVLGGKKDFNKLLDYISKNDYDLFLDVDLTQYRKGSSSYSIRDPFERITNKYHYLRSVYSHDKKTEEIRLLSFDKLYDIANDILKSFNRINNKNVSLGNIGDYLYSNFSEKNFISRTESANEIIKVLSEFKENNYHIAVDGGNAFTLPYIDKVYNAPTSSSNYDFFNDSIPFYQIVLHGVITMSGDSVLQSTEPINSYLKAVETGSEITYSCIYEDSDVLINTRYDGLYSSTYNLWEDYASEQYAKYYDLQQKIYDKAITKHFKLSESIYCTEYENGVKVVVNYSNSDFEYHGAIIGKRDFCIMDKEM